MSLRSIRATLRMGAFVASFVKRDRAIGDFQAERCPDGSVHQRNLASVGAHKFVRDHEAEPGASGPRRSLERLKQMRPCLIREARTGVRNLDDRDGPLAPPGEPDLSRNAYYATGHPCACPDDLMRNGRRCGGNSAYIRPGGAHSRPRESQRPLARTISYFSNGLARFPLSISVR